MEQLRSPARLAGDAADLRARLPGEVSQPDRRSWLDAQLVAIETLARVKAGEPITYLEQVERCLTLRPERRPDDVFERAARELETLLPGAGSLADRLAAEDAAWTVDPDRVAAVVGRPRPAVPRARRPPCSSSRTARPCACPSSMTSRGPATTGTTAATGPASTSTWTSRSASRTFVGVIAHETYPGPPPRARHEGAGARGRARPARVVDPAHQHARVPAVRGARERRSRHRRPAGGDARPPPRAGAGRRAADGRRPRRAAGGRRAPGGRRGPSGDARRVAHQRGADAPRRRRVARGGGRVHGRGRADEPGHRRKARRVRLAPAVAPVRLRLHGGRGAAVAVARGRARIATGGALRPPPPGAADAGRDPRRDGRRRSLRAPAPASRRRPASSMPGSPAPAGRTT